MPGDDLPIDISLVHSRRAERLVHHHAPCLFSTFNTNRPHQKKKRQSSISRRTRDKSATVSQRDEARTGHVEGGESEGSPEGRQHDQGVAGCPGEVGVGGHRMGLSLGLRCGWLGCCWRHLSLSLLWTLIIDLNKKKRCGSRQGQSARRQDGRRAERQASFASDQKWACLSDYRHADALWVV